MLPDIVDNTSFKSLKVDNKFIQSITIKALPENLYFLDIVKDIPKDLSYDFSIFVSKMDPIKALNDITLNLGVTQSELNTIKSNQRNVDVISKSNEEAIQFRKKIQVENEEAYFISLILTFYSYDFIQLNKVISAIKAKFYSKNIISECTNFRQLEFYMSNLPLNIRKKEYLDKIYMTTNCLANIFPFYMTNLIDKNGAIIGYSQTKRLCIVDIFSNKYNNSNMCIFGNSGSGKSYFTKLFIIRNFFLERKQIILDVEGEYEDVCHNLNGQILFKDTFFNILEITKRDIEQEDFLEKKINSVLAFISYFKDIDYDYFKAKLYEIYNKFNINSDLNSILVKQEETKVFLDYKLISKDKFPTLNDLLKVLDNNFQKEILKNLIDKELFFFSNITNIDTNNMIYVLNMKSIINTPKLVNIILSSILEKYLNNVHTIIYIDELWKYSTDECMLNQIFNMYKTIRKKNAAIVSITQDITDFFEYKNGMYANSILNNSNFKLFFKTSINNNYKNIFSNINIELSKLSSLVKGEMIMSFNNSNIKIIVKSNKFEREIINENDFSNR